MCLTAQFGAAGLLVWRTDKGIQFVEAFNPSINGKDKALAFEGGPAVPPHSVKLSQVHLSGTLLKDSDSGIVAAYEAGNLTFLLPQGLPKDQAGKSSDVWREATFSYRRVASDKSLSDLQGSAMLAFLAGGTEELGRICTDLSALRVLAGKGKAFEFQTGLISSVVKTFPADPVSARLQTFLAQSMRQRQEQFESGTSGIDVLNEGLKLAALSQDLYPKLPEHRQLRKSLTDRSAWLGRKMAVLHAFASSQEWDAFLLGWRDFENYQQAFPEMSARHTEALTQSLALHQQAGEERLKEGEFASAYREFRLASLRRPSELVLQQKVLMSWTDYSRQVAIDRQGSRKQLSAGQREVIERSLGFAARYQEQNDLQRALDQVKEAERIDGESLPVLLKKAEVLAAQREFTDAIAVLDQYDRLAINEEREKSSHLRNDLLFQRSLSLEKFKVEIRKALSDSSYYRARGLAVQGLRAKGDDPDLLYSAGVTSFITRRPEEGHEYFKRYLDVSGTLDGNPAERTKARLASASKAGVVTEKGNRNWLSGKNLPDNSYYCPLSLAFQPPIERIEASNKMKIAFEWNGDSLKSITPTFEKLDHATGEKKISFVYNDKFPQVINANYDNDFRRPSSDPDERLSQTSVVLLNHPDIDPVAVLQLTGKDLTLGISGNRFFNPFVWEKLHFFRLKYDDRGRVVKAREIADSVGGMGNQWLEFEWDGLQLNAILGYQGSDESHLTRNYERTMQYQDGQLVAEEIQSEGRNSRIKYNYKNGALVSANCEKDLTMDGRSRQVFFRPASGEPRGR